MISTLIGRKIGMTRVFDDNGTERSVSVLQVGPCWVVQKKTKERDGYSSVQLGFDPVPERKKTRPSLGHFKRSGVAPCRILKEVREEELSDLNEGDAVKVGVFVAGQKVDVTGISKGRGMQGVIKRWHAKGGPDGHGSMRHRCPGSSGASSFPAEVWKGKHVPGRMGGDRVTTKNLRVVDVDEEKALLLVEGSVPGPNGGLILVRRGR